MVLNDAGVIGLSLNGKSFPATAPVMAKVGETDADRLLQRRAADPPDAPARHAAARDRQGRVPGAAAVLRSTRSPSRRASATRCSSHPTAGQEGVWAFHCHILNHAEGDNGMFGMVTTFIVQ